MREILHITPHLGGGVGTVIKGWIEKAPGHTVMCLEEPKIARMPYNMLSKKLMEEADIIVVHYWDHPTIEYLLPQLPPCRLAFWCHKNYPVSQAEKEFPDIFLGVAPVQGHDRWIWSTGGIEKYLNVTRANMPFFNVGYIGWVDYKKMHPDFLKLCHGVDIRGIRFYVCGENLTGEDSTWKVLFTEHVDRVEDYLCIFDVFGYPLRPDHFGTCEQVLGEAMAAGVVPVVMNNPAERYIVEDGISGFVAKNEKEYVGLIEFLYKYPSIRSAMSYAARLRARKLYSIDRMVMEWEKVFDELMEQPKRRKKK